jgi:ribosomal protein S18 acetylase RimI-like enzyme
MRSFYETHIGWKPRRKKQELSDEQHHYVLVTRTTDQELMAFLAFRFTQEDDYDPPESCVYVYELQVDASFRRLKLGSFLMDVAEGIAQHQQCSRVLLTSFLDNAEANAFYARLGYTMDETSPQKVLSKEKAADFSYAILSKRVSPPKVNT